MEDCFPSGAIRGSAEGPHPPPNTRCHWEVTPRPFPDELRGRRRLQREPEFQEGGEGIWRRAPRGAKPQTASAPPVSRERRSVQRPSYRLRRIRGASTGRKGESTAAPLQTPRQVTSDHGLGLPSPAPPPRGGGLSRGSTSGPCCWGFLWRARIPSQSRFKACGVDIKMVTTHQNMQF